MIGVSKPPQSEQNIDVWVPRKLESGGNWSPTVVAWLRLGVSLEQGYRERQLLMVFIGREPLFDPIRQDRRFQDLVSRMGLTR